MEPKEILNIWYNFFFAPPMVLQLTLILLITGKQAVFFVFWAAPTPSCKQVTRFLCVCSLSVETQRTHVGCLVVDAAYKINNTLKRRRTQIKYAVFFVFWAAASGNPLSFFSNKILMDADAGSEVIPLRVGSVAEVSNLKICSFSWW